MSGVYTLRGRAGWGCWAGGVGLLSACGCVPACGLWLSWLLASSSPACVLTPGQFDQVPTSTPG